MDKHYLYAALAPIIWGTMGLFVRMSSLDGIAVFFYTAVFSVLFFTAILAARGELTPLFRKPGLVLLVGIGINVIAINATYFMSYKLATISAATFIHYLAPPFVLLFTPFILKERSSRKIWIPIVLGIGGLFVMLNPFTTDLSNAFLLGALLAFISAIAYGLAIVLNRKATQSFNAYEIGLISMLQPVIFLLPYVLWRKAALLPGEIGIFAILGIVHQGLAVIFILKALEKLKAQNVSIITYLEPLAAVFVGVIFFAEIPTIWTLLGGLIILLSAYLATRE